MARLFVDAVLFGWVLRCVSSALVERHETWSVTDDDYYDYQDMHGEKYTIKNLYALDRSDLKCDGDKPKPGSPPPARYEKFSGEIKKICTDCASDIGQILWTRTESGTNPEGAGDSAEDEKIRAALKIAGTGIPYLWSGFNFGLHKEGSLTVPKDSETFDGLPAPAHFDVLLHGINFAGGTGYTMDMTPFGIVAGKEISFMDERNDCANQKVWAFASKNYATVIAHSSTGMFGMVFNYGPDMIAGSTQIKQEAPTLIKILKSDTKLKVNVRVFNLQSEEDGASKTTCADLFVKFPPLPALQAAIKENGGDLKCVDCKDDSGKKTVQTLKKCVADEQQKEWKKL